MGLNLFKGFIKRHFRALLLLFIFLVQISILFIFKGEIHTIIDELKISEYRLQALLLLLIASPYAYSIWIWKDKAKQKELSNAQANFLQSEFFKVQEWLSDSSKPALQVSSLFKLRDFLAGRHGEEFMTPAVQTLLYTIRAEALNRKNNNFTPLELAFRDVLTTEPDLFFRLSELNKFEGLNLSGASFEDIELSEVKFLNNILRDVNYDGSVLKNVEFISSDLYGATFIGCQLINVDISDTDLTNVDFSASFYESKIHIPKGAIYANGDMTLTSSFIDGDVIVTGNLKLNLGTVITGDLHYGKLSMDVGTRIGGKLIHIDHHSDNQNTT